MNKWISVKDEVPAEETLVLSMYQNEHIIIQIIYSVDYQYPTIWVDENHSAEYDFDDITHWMPLPEPPNE